MSDYAIQVENLGKCYRIGAAQERPDSLHEVWEGFVRRKQRPSAKTTEFWALKDVSFDVPRGDIIGVIGRNGAGKSTLLKILSRITEPTEGRAVLHGRVGSLLEVGTGFHPELTGRENVYLSGAILGMRRAEIDRQFDEIVAFAEIEKFLDTPVKRYSSGMYVRLAFAVAAHLNPEILLVDEVLAVGDAQFQKKCLGKMGDVASEGRTVVFISHNMGAVQALCESAVWLSQGRVSGIGPTDETIRRYAASLFPAMSQDLSGGVNREGNGRMRFLGLRATSADGEPIASPSSGDDVTFELQFESQRLPKVSNITFSLAFHSLMGQPLFLCRSDIQGTDYRELPRRGSVFCRVPRLPLPPGSFKVNLHCEVNGEIADWVRDALQIEVQVGDFYGSGRLPDLRRGDVLVEHEWLATQVRGNGCR